MPFSFSIGHVHKDFLASRPFNKKMPLPSAFWPNFFDPSTLKIFLTYWYSIKKYIYHSIIWRWAVLCKKQDGGWIKICEIFPGKSFKEDLSIDTTFDPSYFSWDCPFKANNLWGKNRFLFKGPLAICIKRLWRCIEYLIQRTWFIKFYYIGTKTNS